MNYRIIKNKAGEFIPQYRFWFMLLPFWTGFHRSTGYMSYDDLTFDSLDSAINFIKMKKDESEKIRKSESNYKTVIEVYDDKGERI